MAATLSVFIEVWKDVISKPDSRHVQHLLMTFISYWRAVNVTTDVLFRFLIMSSHVLCCVFILC